MTFVESNRRPRKYTKKVFLVSVSLCRHLPYGIQKNVFLFAFPENTPRIWIGDMAQGYGTGICGGDMRAETKMPAEGGLRYGKMDMAGD